MAHFVLSDFLNLSLQQSADTSSPLLGLNMAPAESLMLKNPSRPVARASQGLPTESLSPQNPKGSRGSKDRAADADKVALQTQPDAGACCKTAGWCSVHDARHAGAALCCQQLLMCTLLAPQGDACNMSHQTIAL